MKRGAKKNAGGSFRENVLPLLPYLSRYKAGLTVFLLLGVAGAVLNLIIPDVVRECARVIQDGMETEIDTGAVVRYAARGLACAAGLFALNLIHARRMARYGRLIGEDIQNSIDSKVNRLSVARLGGISAGDMLTYTMADIVNVTNFVSKSLGQAVINGLLLLGSVAVMCVYSLPLALCAVFFVGLGFAVSILLSQKTAPMVQQQQMTLAKLNSHISETLTGHEVVKSFNAEQEVRERFHRTNQEFVDSRRRSQFLLALVTPLTSFIGYLSYIAVFMLGAWLIHSGSGMNVSTLIAFLLYSGTLKSALGGISGVVSQVVPGYISAGRISKLLTEQEMEDEGTRKPGSVRGQVEFDHVCFGYTEDREIIHDFSAVIRPGMKVAIVGPTGAGKTTLVNLLMRFYELRGGSIRIDGTDLTEIPRRDLHEMLGMVLQDPWTFSGTIRENIVYTSQGVTQEEWDSVIRRCGLDYLIRTLPEKENTVLSESTAVSAGQRQLITIARVMLRHPEILILDEATSSVDTRTERLIQSAMDDLMKGRTSFVIAHRLATIRNADLIFVMKDGTIAETGTHEELLRRSGLYAELYRSQFEQA